MPSTPGRVSPGLVWWSRRLHQPELLCGFCLLLMDNLMWVLGQQWRACSTVRLSGRSKHVPSTIKHVDFRGEDSTPVVDLLELSAVIACWGVCTTGSPPLPQSFINIQTLAGYGACLYWGSWGRKITAYSRPDGYIMSSKPPELHIKTLSQKNTTLFPYWVDSLFLPMSLNTINN